MAFTVQLLSNVLPLQSCSTMCMPLGQSHRVKAYFFNIHGSHKSQLIALIATIYQLTVQVFPVFFPSYKNCCNKHFCEHI